MRSRLAVWALVAGVAAWVLADVLFGGRQFAYRDAGHYFPSLFRLVWQEWAAGRVPLWNPLEGIGAPLAAGGTSSVFYPGQLIFALPLSFDWAWRIYVTGHLLMAAGTAYWLARRWEASVEAAGIAAVSYAFSGTVLSQHANVVYLVGAAWLPLALWAADRMLAERRVWWPVVLGAVLAMMVLGGDPQVAYHACLLAVGLAAAIRLARRASPPSTRPDASSLRPAPLMLALAGIAAAALCAVQLLPSIEFLRRSDRAAGPAAGTLFELPEAIGNGRLAEWDEGVLCRRFPRGTHLAQVYEFSVGPWRVAEFLWPNCSGRQFPVHRRWLDALPAEGRAWIPSLYMGLLPLVLAISAMRRTRQVGTGEPISGGRSRFSRSEHGTVPLRNAASSRTPERGAWLDRYLSWAVAVFGLGSLGWYGLGWLVHEVRAAAGGDPASPWPVGQPFGGVYWLMTALLPGYVRFRYPAKLLVVVALGLSLLAARGWDRARSDPGGRLHRWLSWLGVASLAGAMAVAVALPFWAGWFSGAAASPLFGPLDATGAAADLIRALVHTSAVCGLGVWVLLGARRAARWAGTAALVLVAVDLAVANRWMVGTAAAETRQRPTGLVRAIDEHRQQREGSDDAGPWRAYRRPHWTPAAWEESSSAARLDDAVRWQRATLQPKHHLDSGVALAEVPDAMNLEDYHFFLAAARRRAGTARLDPLPRPEVLHALGASYLILRGNERPDGAAPVDSPALRDLDDLSLWHNPAALPRAWIVHRVEVVPPLESNSPRAMLEWTERVLDDGRRPRDFARSAVVETEEELSQPFAEPAPAGETCRVIDYGPQRVELEAVLRAPGLVVLSDQFYPGWTLAVRSDDDGPRDVPILRTNRVMRGAWLPAGNHRLVFRYRPAAFVWGAAISIVGWVVAGGLGVRWLARRRRARKSARPAGSAG